MESFERGIRTFHPDFQDRIRKAATEGLTESAELTRHIVVSEGRLEELREQVGNLLRIIKEKNQIIAEQSREIAEMRHRYNGLAGQVELARRLRRSFSAVEQLASSIDDLGCIGDTVGPLVDSELAAHVIRLQTRLNKQRDKATSTLQATFKRSPAQPRMSPPGDDPGFADSANSKIAGNKPMTKDYLGIKQTTT
jgi:predicted nuclease with TOPRIM domain